MNARASFFLLLFSSFIACIEIPVLSDEEQELTPALGGTPTWGDMLEGENAPIPPSSNTPSPLQPTMSLDLGSTGSRPRQGDPTSPQQQDPGLIHLRILQFLPNPAGKDGGELSPERIEIRNTGAKSVRLDALVIETRSWPELDASDLGIEQTLLPSGESLVVLRYASGESIPTPPSDSVDGAIYRAFQTSSGLRNADGAILLRTLHDDLLDLII